MQKVQPPSQKPTGNDSGRNFDTQPVVPIGETDRNEVMCLIRQVFSTGGPRDRGTAIRELSGALGYHRVGPAIRETLDRDLLTAVRRGILQNERGELSLLARSISEYQRGFLKDMFLSDMGNTWWDREAAISATARYLGFARTGPNLHGEFKSIINGLIREQRLEAEGNVIRKTRRPK